MSTGKINVQADNIFPIIKKFLYSDHEIFLRELVSNATDATSKLKALASIGEYKGEVGEPKIEIKIDQDKKTLHVLDQGIGMTAEEVEKYINQVAFSGAEEFVTQYKEKTDQAQAIIGHFGLGFYSAFMVADKVEIITKSFKDEPAAHWICEGETDFTLTEHDKKERGTEIILHINDENKEFLEEHRINELLRKYCKFMPVPIKMGTREETKGTGKYEGEGEDKKEITETITVDHIVNNPTPAWVKKPSDLQDEDYVAFYRELYPMQFEEPLFNIHLNVDYPFNLTGILYFPKLKNNMQVEKDKIQLYQNQVFVTDNVEGIVPDFLTLLRGVIDSPDIPLNVSRSYLQADGAVKKISGYITRKVADKFNSLFKNDREDFQKKWDDIKIIVEYGMLTEEKFLEKADNFTLYKTVDDAFFTFEELKEKISETHKNKEGKVVVLYTADKVAQHAYIESAKAKGYEVIIFDSPLSSHLIQKLEQKHSDFVFTRVDADHIDKLIQKEENTTSKLSEEEQTTLKEAISANVETPKFTVQLENLDSSDQPFIITVPEFMRRMKEMNQLGGGMMMGMGDFPESYNLVINTNHELAGKILQAQEEEKSALIKRAMNLALLSQNLLHGEALTRFVKEGFAKL